jgi:hypothetical protein
MLVLWSSDVGGHASGDSGLSLECGTRDQDHGACPSRAAQAVHLLTRRSLTLALQRCNDICRWHAPMPQNIDGAVARWCKAGGTARSNGLIMRPANAANRRFVALPPSRRATAQDSPPEDHQLQVRKAAAFSGGLWPGGQSRHMLRASSGTCKATLKGAVGEIVTLIIQVRATLFRIAQGHPQACDPPGRNGFERCSVHFLPDLDCFSPTIHDGRKRRHPEFLLSCRRVHPVNAWAAADLSRVPTRHRPAPQTCDRPGHRSGRTDGSVANPEHG